MSVTQLCHGASPRPERSQPVVRGHLYPSYRGPALRARLGVRGLWGERQALLEAEQAEHVKKCCSYPEARIILVRMIFSKCMSAPHAIQRIGSHSA
jgi:hypothetical protein